jgi:hypothetical protein
VRFRRCLKQPKEDVLCGSIGAIAKVADRHGGAVDAEWEENGKRFRRRFRRNLMPIELCWLSFFMRFY